MTKKICEICNKEFTARTHNVKACNNGCRRERERRMRNPK